MKSQHALAKARPQNVRPPAAGTAQEPRRESQRGAATRNTGPVAEALSSFISNGCRRDKRERASCWHGIRARRRPLTPLFQRPAG